MLPKVKLEILGQTLDDRDLDLLIIGKHLILFILLKSEDLHFF